MSHLNVFYFVHHTFGVALLPLL